MLWREEFQSLNTMIFCEALTDIRFFSEASSHCVKKNLRAELQGREAFEYEMVKSRTVNRIEYGQRSPVLYCL